MAKEILFGAPTWPVSVDTVTAGLYLSVSAWKAQRIPPPNPGLPVAINLPFQLFGKTTPVLNDVLEEDRTLSSRTQMGRAALVMFPEKLMLTPFCENNPNFVTGAAKVMVVFEGRIEEKLLAVQSRLASTVKE